MVKDVQTYADVVKTGKMELKKEKNVTIKPEKQENVDSREEHWIVVESKKAIKAAAAASTTKKSGLLPSSKGERRRTLTTIECKCSVVECKREAASRYRCCACKER